MNLPIPLDETSKEIRAIYRADPEGSELRVEKFLAEKLKGIPPDEKIRVLQALAQKSEDESSSRDASLSLRAEDFTKYFSLLLGHPISVSDLCSADFWEKFGASLNTVFDKVNQIIAVIHMTLLGRRAELETIRQIISSSLEDEKRTESLQNYLDQIREAFVVAHRAFQEAALNQAQLLLAELAPQKLEKEAEGRLKFGPFLKADLFDSYKGRFEEIEAWVHSDRFREELLRAFEKIGQRLYKREPGGPL